MIKENGINRKILKIAGPSILANITIPLVGIVDVAISGRLGNASMIGGMAIGTMLFELLYWNFGFLRIGTAGITAQAYGRRDLRDSVRTLEQSLSTALLVAFILLAIQFVFVKTALLIVDTSPHVAQLAREYFLIRIWAAPATLSIFAFKGWFLGMQNAKSPMAIDILVNVVNLVACYILALHTRLGFAGIAYGTVIAQYSGLALSVSLLFFNYRKLFKYFHLRDSLNFGKMKAFFKTGGNLMIRSVSFLFIYSGFTVFAAKYGDTLLAVSTIIMKLMLLYSYFIDGFSYAGEALSGRFIGAKDLVSLKKSIRILFMWSLGIGFVSTFLYLFGGELLFGIMTTNPTVISASKEFLPWLVFMPIISCVAFIWDGIYIGATASVSIRNTMVISAVVFFVFYYVLEPYVGIHALMAGYFAHLALRTILMSLNAKKQVILKIAV